MACHACWLNDLRKAPCLQAPGYRYAISIPAVVTLDCYVIMTQPWSKPGGHVFLVSFLDGIPMTCSRALCSAPVKGELVRHLGGLTEDLGELKSLVKLVLGIWPSTPWFDGCLRQRVIQLERVMNIRHSPFAADDGRGRKSYEADMDKVLGYGPPLKVSSWDEWFALREEKAREGNNDKHNPKSGRGS